MLLRYAVSNYKSIGHRIEFSMFPTQENHDERFLTSISTRMGEWKNSKQRILAETLKESMQENQKNQLFLYKLFDNGVKRVESIVSWFENVMVIYPQSKFRRLPIRVQTDEELKEFLSETLSKLDTGVFKISASTKQMSLSDFVKKEEVLEKIVEEIESKEGGIINISGKYYIFVGKENDTMLVQLKFEHHLNNKIYEFDIEDESDGTQRLLDLLPNRERLREQKAPLQKEKKVKREHYNIEKVKDAIKRAKKLHEEEFKTCRDEFEKQESIRWPHTLGTTVYKLLDEIVEIQRQMSL